MAAMAVVQLPAAKERRGRGEKEYLCLGRIWDSWVSDWAAGSMPQGAVNIRDAETPLQ